MMKIVNVIAVLFCFTFHSCKNEPKELLETKSYFLPEICSDSILVLGKDSVNRKINTIYEISKVYNLRKQRIKQYEPLIEKEIVKYENSKDSILIMYLNKNNINNLRRQYLLYKRNDGKTIVIISFLNPNYKTDSLTKNKNSFPMPCDFQNLGVIRIEIDAKKKIVLRTLRY